LAAHCREFLTPGLLIGFPNPSSFIDRRAGGGLFRKWSIKCNRHPAPGDAAPMRGLRSR
jgi:hypothetical protein